MSINDHQGAITRLRRAAEGFTLPGAERHYPPDLGLDPIHLDIDLVLDLEAGSAAGTATTVVVARRAFEEKLVLHAVALEDVQVRDPDGHALSYDYDGYELAVSWKQPFTRGERRRVAVSYRVVRPTAGLYFSSPSAETPDAPWYAATDHETERARHWLPCIDLPNARPRLDFHLSAPERFTILANGELVAESTDGTGVKTAHWRLDFPCPSYLTAFAIGDFVRADDGEVDGVPIAYFTTQPRTQEDLFRSFGRTGAMLEWLNERLGTPYPFPKYYQIALPGFSGAMENISLVSWDGALVMDEKLASEWTRLLDEINVHEMAHAWFGDAIVCRDYAHAWLKESWATYIQQVWFEENVGEDERQYQYWRDANTYFAEADGRYKRPIVTREFNSSWNMYDTHLYQGGACRLHTLRCELGDEDFWAGVRDYVADNMGGVVETDDFRRSLEKRSGRSLGKLFDMWFHSPGYPKLKVEFEYDAKRGEGRWVIEQKQIDAKADVPAFELRTEVGWTVDGQTHTAPAIVSGRKTTVIAPMEKKPDIVRFDPRHLVLHSLDFNPGGAWLRRQLVEASDVIGRIQAGRELAKTGTRANVEAIRQAYVHEPFWGVRVAWAQALSTSGGLAAIETLAEWIGAEQEELVLAPLIRAAGAYRDPRVGEAIVARLDALGGLPYHATAAAMEALGNQGEAAPFERIAEALTTHSFEGFVQAGAVRALARSPHAGALEVLIGAAANSSSPRRARHAAAIALGEYAGRLPAHSAERARAEEKLRDLLRDPVEHVRFAAVAGLEAMGASGATDALGAFRAPLAHQDQIRVDRALSRIRKGDSPKITALEKQVDELRDDLRTLEDKVGKLAALGEAEDADDDDSAPTSGSS